VEPTRYTLTVFEPGSSRSQAGSYESSTPFAAISVGDAVHAAGWPKQGPAQGPSSYLRTTEVHHYLGERAGQVRHHVTVYTEEVVLR
jgi:hypothetical protein